MEELVAAHRNGGGAQLRRVRVGWTPAKRRKFIAELAQTMNVRSAARMAGMTESAAYKLRVRDPGFRAAWAEALSEGYERVETLLLERAIQGLSTDLEPGDASRLEKLSERTLMSMLSHHRQAVREHRDGEARASAAQLAVEEGSARERLAARLDQIAERLTGAGDAQ